MLIIVLFDIKGNISWKWFAFWLRWPQFQTRRSAMHLSKMRIIFVFQFFFFRQIVSELQQVLKFDPKFGSDNYDVDVAKLVTDTSKSTANGYSVCIRANYAIMNTNCLFKATNNLDLTFFEYRRGGGSLSFKAVDTNFQSDPDILDRLSTWQSYCVILTPMPAIQVLKSKWLFS